MTDRSPDRLLETAIAEIGAEYARFAEEERPGSPPAAVVVEPPDPDSAGSILAWASREKLSVAIRGGGTKIAWGPALAPVDLVLSTGRLHQVVAHRHGDLTATVQAGLTLEGVNAVLGMHRQWIPLDPYEPGHATIGGVVATNDSGPRRHRHGAPRDLIIGVSIVRADGRAAKAGGIVVKNVAGYDLARLMTGSLGSLALIVDATFKLAPVPPASRTVVIETEHPTTLAWWLGDLASAPLAPTAVELQTPPGRLLVRFESTEQAVAAQAEAVAKLAEGQPAELRILADDEETALWRAHAERPWVGSGLVAKVSTAPGQVPTLVDWIQDWARGGVRGEGAVGKEGAADSLAWELVGRAGTGVLLLRLEGSAQVQAETIVKLRSRFSSGDGYVTLLRADPEVIERAGVWGDLGGTVPIMRAIKQQLDPAGIFNPGRGPAGI